MLSTEDIIRLAPQMDHALKGFLMLVSLCSIRLSIIVLLLPPLDASVLQPMIRTGMTIMFSFYVAYGQPPSSIDSMSAVQLMYFACREAIIGFMLGFAASSVFWMAQGAGTLIDDLTGYNNVQISNPNNPITFTPTSLLFNQIATTVFWVLGGMMSLLGAVYESYHWWPLLSTTPMTGNILESFAIQQTDTLVTGVLKLSAPIMLILLLVDVGFGMVSRAAPRLDLISLTQPVKAGAMIMVLAQFVALFIENLRGELTLQHLQDKLHTIAGTMVH
jgi:type III secretion protein T